MALVSLLRMGSSPTERATYAFEHFNAHRTLFGAMAPLTRFSVLPYQLDPQQTDGMYLLRHQQAHWDMVDALPSYPPVTDQVGGLALHNDQILGEPTPWTIFANHVEHTIAMSVYPLPDALTYPFW